jgi:hypothetical protein
LALEHIQDQIFTDDFNTKPLLTNGDDRFDLGGEMRVRSDFDGSANVALDIPFVGLEADVL